MTSVFFFQVTFICGQLVLNRDFTSPLFNTKTSSQETGEMLYFPITKQRCFAPRHVENAAQHTWVWHLKGIFFPPQFNSVPVLTTPQAPANFSQPKLWFCMSFYQNRSIFSISCTVLHTICNAVALQFLNSNLCAHWNEYNAQNSIKTYKTIQENPWGKTDSQVLLLRNIHSPTLKEHFGKNNWNYYTE